MNRKKREELVRELMSARGWIDCWLPMFSDPEEGNIVSARATVLRQASLAIKNVMVKLGHTGGGLCKPPPASEGVNDG